MTLFADYHENWLKQHETEIEKMKKKEPAIEPERVIDMLRSNYKEWKLPGFTSKDNTKMARFFDIGITYVEVPITIMGEETGERRETVWDSLWDEERRKRCILVGVAGSGKSSTLAWLANQWSKGKLWNRKFDAVIWVKVQSGKSLKQLVSASLYPSSSFKEKKKQLEQFFDWCLKNSSKVLWILDNCDEANLKQDIEDVLRNLQPQTEKLVKYMIAGVRERIFDCVDVIELGRLSTTNKEIFISHYFRRSLHPVWTFLLCLQRLKVDFGKALRARLVAPLLGVSYRGTPQEIAYQRNAKEFINSSRALFEACHVPLMLKLSCFSVLCMKKGTNLLTKTDLYDFVVREHVEGKSKTQRRLHKLAWLSFGKSILKESLIDKACKGKRKQIDAIKRCGLLVKGTFNEWEWLHGSFASFLAACWVCEKYEDNRLSQELKGVEDNLFLQFVCDVEGGKALKSFDVWYPWSKREANMLWLRWLNELAPERAKLLHPAVLEWWDRKVGSDKEAMGDQFSKCCAWGLLGVVELLLSLDKSYASWTTTRWRNRSCLIEACRSKKLPMVELLIRNGADVNFQDHAGLSAFTEACVNGDLDIVEKLVEHGAKIDVSTWMVPLWTPTHLINDSRVPSVTSFIAACRRGHFDLVKWFVENNHIDLRTYGISSEHDTPLAAALEGGHLNIAKYLVSRGADIHDDDLLFLAITFQQPAILLWLLDRGSVRSENMKQFGYSLIHLACLTLGKAYGGYRPQKIDFLEFVLEHVGGNIDAIDSFGRTPLSWCCLAGVIEAVKLLHARGANPNHIDNNGSSCLVLALQGEAPNLQKKEKDPISHGGRRVEVAKYLMENGADMNQSDLNNLSPLVHALNFELEVRAKGFDLGLVRFMIQHGADIHTSFITLYFAGIYDSLGREDVLLFLQELGVDLGLAWFFGVCMEKIDVLKSLIRTGVVSDINRISGGVPSGMTIEPIESSMLQSGIGMNALHLSCRDGHIEVVSFLLKHEANVNAIDAFGFSALAYAICNEKFDICQLLLKCGADANIEFSLERTNLANFCGSLKRVTPLAFAVMHDMPVVKILIESGADVLS